MGTHQELSMATTPVTQTKPDLPIPEKHQQFSILQITAVTSQQAITVLKLGKLCRI